jgi:hypothetical protein
MPGTIRTFVRRSLVLDNHLVRRFALALVVAFATFGVVAYTQGLEELETLAGPAVILEEDSGCPDGFLAVDWERGTPPDKNGDGIVCANKIEIVDNEDFKDPGTARHVTGHGNVLVGGKKIIQDISFSFHGIPIEGEKSRSAKGQFEYHDQTGVGPDLTVHGDVICVSVNGNLASFLGIVTRSNDLNIAVDDIVAWQAEDNGEGSADAPDRLSRLSSAGQKGPREGCGFTPKPKEEEEGAEKVPAGSDLVDIIGGNIQVHEDETAAGPPKLLEEKDPSEVSSDADDVNGHGNFFDKGLRGQQDISFSFHAIGTGADGKFVDDTAKGQFEYHDQTGGGQPLNVHGEILCASVSGNSARLIGIVTNSNDKSLRADMLVTWSTVDNGEGVGAPPDLISRLSALGGKFGGCKEKKAPEPEAGTLLPIVSGNIQVH